MTQSLAQLQAEWRAYAEPIKTNDFLRLGYLACADALQPHIKREAAAQAKSLADERRIMDLEAQLSAEHTRRLAAEKVIWAVETPMRRSGLINDVLDEYRTQYPRVEEKK